LALNEKKRLKLKDVEVRLIAELMKNSRRSDRELAKAIGSSQPTVSRLIKKLEKEGVIKEYTMIPDFRRLGYQIMGFTFFGNPRNTTKENMSPELRKAVAEVEKENPYASLIGVNGIGLGKGRMFMTLYRSYARYAEAMRLLDRLPNLDVEGRESFLVNLNDEGNFRILTLE
jgi:DNA-binding Lrp family transcriptional regulator